MTPRGPGAAFLVPAWPAPPGVHAVTTLRHGLGVSNAPFDAFNLGSRCGDDPHAVSENRRQLVEALRLPAPPRWLRQVHGVGVVRFAATGRPREAGAAAVAPTFSQREVKAHRGTPLEAGNLGVVEDATRSRQSRLVRTRGSEGDCSLSPAHDMPTAAIDRPAGFAPQSEGEHGEGIAVVARDAGLRAGAGSLRAFDADAGVAVDTDADAEREADAAVTSERGIVLAILTADCLPVVLAARDGSELAAAHAGWRGLCAGVLEATVAAMRTPPSGLIAWLGPAAGPDAYEVGAEVFESFVASDGRARVAFVPTRPGHWRADLPMLARQRLLDAGVLAVHGGDHCTISEPDAFFSHRRDGRGGRIATLAWLGD